MLTRIVIPLALILSALGVVYLGQMLITLGNILLFAGGVTATVLLLGGTSAWSLRRSPKDSKSQS